MNTLDGKQVKNTTCIAIRKEPHPFKDGVIYRTYEIDEADGSLFRLGMSGETVEELKETIKKWKSHKTLLFAEI